MTHIFYKSVDIEIHDGVAVLIKEYGPLHFLFLAEIARNHADRPVEYDEFRELFDKWIDGFEKENVSKTHILRRGDSIYTVRVGDLYDGRRKRGYLLEITDDTAHQQHLEWTEKYNKDLNAELKAKTELIRELRHGGSA